MVRVKHVLRLHSNSQDNTESKTLNLPILIDISPMAHVALLHTEMNSGFRLAARMGIKSAGITNKCFKR